MYLSMSFGVVTSTFVAGEIILILGLRISRFCCIVSDMCTSGIPFAESFGCVTDFYNRGKLLTAKLLKLDATGSH